MDSGTWHEADGVAKESQDLETKQRQHDFVHDSNQFG